MFITSSSPSTARHSASDVDLGSLEPHFFIACLCRTPHRLCRSMRTEAEARPRRGVDVDEAELMQVKVGGAAEPPRRRSPMRRRTVYYRRFCFALQLLKRTVLMIPVLLVCAMVFMYWYTFVFVFQADRRVVEATDIVADIWTVVFSVIAVLCLTCYLRCVFTSNSVNDNAPPSSFDSDDCRRCDRCSSLKPSRTHHCSVCGTCQLKMDHHCPWVANCVGHNNHKYFVLFVLYGCLGCNLYILGSMNGIIRMVQQKPRDSATGLTTTFMTLFAVISAFAFGLTLIGFVAFHFYLVCSNQTTLEYGYLGADVSCELRRDL